MRWCCRRGLTLLDRRCSRRLGFDVRFDLRLRSVGNVGFRSSVTFRHCVQRGGAGASVFFADREGFSGKRSSGAAKAGGSVVFASAFGCTRASMTALSSGASSSSSAAVVFTAPAFPPAPRASPPDRRPHRQACPQALSACRQDPSRTHPAAGYRAAGAATLAAASAERSAVTVPSALTSMPPIIAARASIDSLSFLRSSGSSASPASSAA